MHSTVAVVADHNQLLELTLATHAVKTFLWAVQVAVAQELDIV
jgi:hypothetical protein